MATVREASPSIRRAELMRNTWAPVGNILGNAFRHLGDFFVAYPPMLQGAYYVLMGLWPLLHASSFLLVTGHKTDLWLVDTVGALVSVIGATLCVAAYRRQGAPEVFLLAIGSAGALAAVDVVFVSHGTISLVYLLDAALQIGMVCLWLYAWQTGRSELRPCQIQEAPVAQIVPGPGAAPRA